MLCNVPAGKLMITAQACDLNPAAGLALVVPTQTFMCTSPMSLSTVVDIMSNKQTSTIDLSSVSSVSSSLASLLSPVPIRVSFGGCDTRESLPSVDPNGQFMVSIILNDASRQAAQKANASVRGHGGAPIAYQSAVFLYPVSYLFSHGPYAADTFLQISRSSGDVSEWVDAGHFVAGAAGGIATIQLAK